MFLVSKRYRNGAYTSGAVAKRPKGVRKGTRGTPAQQAMAMAKRALQATRQLNAERELKVHESSFTNQPLGNPCGGQWPGAVGDVIGNGGAVLPLCQITQGITGEQTRVGEQICVKEIEIRGKWGTSPDIGSANLRMIVFRDKQQRSVGGVVPLPSEVLQLLRSNSCLYVETAERWEILTDQLFELAKPSASNYAGLQSFAFKKKVNIQVKWDTNASNIVSQNGLYVLLLADHYASSSADLTQNFVVATNDGLIDMQGRVKFQDC